MGLWQQLRFYRGIRKKNLSKTNFKKIKYSVQIFTFTGSKVIKSANLWRFFFSAILEIAIKWIF